MPVPTTPGEAVTARLTADAGFVALADDRVYPGLPTQDGEWPYAVYTIDAGGGGVKLTGTGSAKTKEYVVRVECYARTDAAAEALIQAVADALAGWKDKTNRVHGCFPVEDRNQLSNDDGSRVSGQSFRLFFER